MRKIILGAKYFIKDKINNDILEVKIIQYDELDLTYRDLTTGNEFYREIDEIEIVSIIDEEEAKRLNNQEVFSVKTNFIKAIIGRDEIIKYNDNDFKDIEKDENTVIISITDPGSQPISQNILNKFKDVLSIQFYDIEEDLLQYKTIDEENIIKIKNFVKKNKDNNFLIHCEAGMSRSAAIGKYVSFICECNGDLKKWKNYKCLIDSHHRYYANTDVVKKLIYTES